MTREKTRSRDAAGQGEEMQLAVFRVGGEEYAIDIMRIMEIIRPQKVTRIPKAPEFVEGVVNLRGKVVPILDLRRRFGVDSAQADPKKVRVVIVKMAGRVVGVVVDEVTEVIYMRKDQVEATPDAVKGAGADYLTGVGKFGERLIVLLDMEKVLSGEEVAGLRAAEEMAVRGAGGGGAR
jgi:purine-binding chemotaxis protein CheW